MPTSIIITGMVCLTIIILAMIGDNDKDKK